MKKQLFVLFIFSLLGLFSQVRADEGMWLLHLLGKKHKELKKKGLKLKPEEIYSINKSSIKDAIVSFGGFCTAEVVSEKGLVFTNHHCGYDSIAGLSTETKNYLKNGFWAKNLKEELPAEGLYVKFLIKIGEIPKKIQEELKNEFSSEKRNQLLQVLKKKIEEREAENGKYEIEIKDFFDKNQYYYFVYQIYEDVRLVGTPPSSIGKFGGDTDNWMWPRHTGDFSIFRIYADKNGNPASYHPDNIPYKPKHFLPISIKGIKEGDFSFILGYPGSTERYLSSWGIENLILNEYPSWVEASKTSLMVLEKNRNRSPKVKLNYASQKAIIANYWKNRKGMIEGMIKNYPAGKRKILENRFKKWYNKKNKRKQTYSEVLPTIENFYKENHKLLKTKIYVGFLLRNKTFSFLYDLINIGKSNKEIDFKSLIHKTINDYFSKSDLQTEKDLLAAQLQLYDKRVPIELQGEKFKELKSKFNNNFTKLAEEIFSKSIFSSREAILNSLINNSIFQDPLILLYDSIRIKIRESISEESENNKEKAVQLLSQGIREMQGNKDFYPNANSSMRFSHGNIKSLAKNPKNDAKGGNYYTTLEGLIAKCNPLDEEFDLDEKFIQIARKKDYGPYVNANGELPVNFLSNNDITGGNSGSPVMNNKGELIGIAFDGNWEAMSGDISFENNFQRTISVDVRYILYILDKLAEAKNILDELKLVY